MNGTISSESELEALYDAPVATSILKEIDHVSQDYARWILASPLVILATSGPEGLDCSPRGDPKGFVRVADPKTLMIPDRRGNNRIDSLRNIVRDPRVALLFLIPGIDGTMRVYGRAERNASSQCMSSAPTRSAKRLWCAAGYGTRQRISPHQTCPASARCFSGCRRGSSTARPMRRLIRSG
jgi:PPOX class probable FMN-dependent enzyme